MNDWSDPAEEAREGPGAPPLDEARHPSSGGPASRWVGWQIESEERHALKEQTLLVGK